jgi:hypothetical protein
MSTDRRIRASRANGALSRGPKTEGGKQRWRLNAVRTGAFAKSIVLKNESPALLAKLRDEYYQHLQPANPIERNLVEEMVVSKSPLCRRAWRLESSSVNYKMDQQKDAAEAQHSSLQEHTRTAIAHTDLYDNSVALPHIQRSQARNSRFRRALRQLQDLRRNQQSNYDQTDLIPNTDTKSKNNHSNLVSYSDSASPHKRPPREVNAFSRASSNAQKKPRANDEIGARLVGQDAIPPHPAILELK